MYEVILKKATIKSRQGIGIVEGDYRSDSEEKQGGSEYRLCLSNLEVNSFNYVIRINYLNNPSILEKCDQVNNWKIKGSGTVEISYPGRIDNGNLEFGFIPATRTKVTIKNEKNPYVYMLIDWDHNKSITLMSCQQSLCPEIGDPLKEEKKDIESHHNVINAMFTIIKNEISSIYLVFTDEAIPSLVIRLAFYCIQTGSEEEISSIYNKLKAKDGITQVLSYNLFKDLCIAVKKILGLNEKLEPPQKGYFFSTNHDSNYDERHFKWVSRQQGSKIDLSYCPGYRTNFVYFPERVYVKK